MWTAGDFHRNKEIDLLEVGERAWSVGYRDTVGPQWMRLISLHARAERAVGSDPIVRRPGAVYHRGEIRRIVDEKPL